MNVKKYGIFVVLVFGFIAVILFRNQKTEVYTAASLVGGQNYCLAIRGNGELEPAHWGAMARVVEQLGLPHAMAGGSSATISMFMLNAVAQNSFVQVETIDAHERSRRAALLVKSFLGFFTELKNTKFSQDFYKFYGEYEQKKAQGMTKTMTFELLQNNFKTVFRSLQEGIKSGLFEEHSLKPLATALLKNDRKRSEFYMQQLSETVKLFGKFDANTDANIFFRPGLISFSNASESFGRWAAFYGSSQISETTQIGWTNFFKQCSAESENISWTALVSKKPECGVLFHEIFEAYFQKEPAAHLEDRPIGKPIAVYPSTSILMGSSAELFRRAQIEYDQKLDPKYGLGFKIQNSDEIKFGYWGNPSQLKLIQSKLDVTDEKNLRFLGLGEATWKEVISLSPAEPGLSPLIPFKTADKRELVSAGGWSDLQPVAVLKASGCDEVVYLTRRGGESLFAQGVANRLMNMDRDLTQVTAAQNEVGDPSFDSKSLWSRLFNMADPKSSVNRALANADAVLCTNWNDFDVQKDLLGLVEDSYGAAFWLNPQLPQTRPDFKLTPPLKDERPGCQPRGLNQ